MVAVGIRSILNFAPTILSVPEGVDVRRVDLSSELQILAYHEQRKSSGADAGSRLPAWTEPVSSATSTARAVGRWPR